ncbi:MAG: hypothetical protein JNN28_19465 [Saprospiraceae bacterium]|nr:hypothetical protein [Saprospiraceae bacterium]
MKYNLWLNVGSVAMDTALPRNYYKFRMRGLWQAKYMYSLLSVLILFKGVLETVVESTSLVTKIIIKGLKKSVFLQEERLPSAINF